MDRHPHSEGFGIHQYWVGVEFGTLPIFSWMFRLEMVEPLEETRTELIFATEPLLSSLEASIPGSSRFSPLVELDEIEVRLDHESTMPGHSNICISDPKGRTANMQRPLLLAYVCKINSHKYITGDCDH
jgi:hypothetical protein